MDGSTEEREELSLLSTGPLKLAAHSKRPGQLLSGHNYGHSSKRGEASRDFVGNVSLPESAEFVVSADGLEPSTHALKGHCSTN